MSLIIKGKVWKFSDHVNTDYIDPGFSRSDKFEQTKENILHIHKQFGRLVKPGDVIVAGKNFGCGSSRETAPLNLSKLGIGCVVAESFARIFLRNAIAISFPVMPFPGVSKLFEEGQELELDFKNALLRNLTTGVQIKGTGLPPFLIDIITAGGLISSLRQANSVSD